MRSFQNSGAIDVVASRGADVRPDFMLQTNIAAFQAQPDAFAALADRVTGPEKANSARKILAAYALLRQHRYGEIGSAEFDEMCFGEAMPRRRLDPRQ